MIVPSASESLWPDERTPFDRPGDLGQIDSRCDQDMHVVRHHHESVELVPAVGILPEAVYNALSDFGLAQPNRSIGSAIQRLIALDKHAPILNAPVESRKRARQTPRDKQGGARRMPMRKVSPIHSTKEVGDGGESSQHGTSQAEACATILLTHDLENVETLARGFSPAVRAGLKARAASRPPS